MTPQAERRDRSQLTVILGIFLVLLVRGVVWKFFVPMAGPFDWRALNLIPFHNALGFSVQPEEVIVNVLLFVPLGLLLRVRGASFATWYPYAVIVGTSLLCEVLQLVFGVGTADTTDLITNSVGGIIGMAVIPSRWTRGLARHRLTVAAWVCLAILTCIAVVIAIDPSKALGFLF